MIYIKAFLYKEFCELKSSKNSILLLIFLTLIPLMASFNDPLAFIEFDLQIKYLLCLVPFAVSGQLSLNLIENEKKNNAFDIVLSKEIPRYAIFIGKALPSIIIGFIYFIISLILLKVFAIFIPRLSLFNLSFEIIGMGLFISYIGTSVSFLSNILIQDQRFVPLGAFIIIAICLGSLYLVNRIITLPYVINLLILIAIAIILNFLAINLLNKTKRLIMWKWKSWS